MSVYKYKPAVVKEVLECKTERLTDSIEARYCLSIKLNNNLDSSHVFIMLNPSIADKEVSDLTITKLCNFSHSLNEVGSIHIVNLYPFYETNSAELSSIIHKLQKENSSLYEATVKTNHQIIANLAKESKKVIFAWGDCPKRFDKRSFNKQCNDVKQLLKGINKDEAFVIKTHYNRLLTVKNSPRHPSRPGLKWLEAYHEHELDA
ncbi:MULTISPECIES: DUF1643 domain-containing protein [Bacillus]|uniref:DUF1643 domain-containing protein n=1 Tax=Bacillus TaxID=1386 RepID=UPI0006AFAD4E|nr:MULTISPECIES: DUF1643 domain-containing protein [Bacillus]KAF6690709.1 DUF1643 domain-containing protein [Bacillus sp. EKM601B]KOS49229.1 hypothetical protein AN272_19495 [Bacillus amyloliquefaciens]MBA9149708.1 DUF1643 domain-containing protein [Bacillus sp. EKM213B]MDZ7434204.1 DUF1643 domain-containing protein [Bacillus amyloliquefaciens]MEC1018706.1 DUF1643 domain-containing protein [Bacillus velezensis]